MLRPCRLALSGIACLYLLAAPAQSTPFFGKEKQGYIPQQNNEEYDLIERSSVAGQFISALSVVYGSAMIVYGRHVPSQLQTVTVMRVAGLPRLKAAAKDLRRNVRQTTRSVLWHSPSLLVAQKALKGLNDRADMSIEVMAKTKAAKADGVITAKEEREICKLQKKQLKLIRRDMKRIYRGSSACYRIWSTLDLDEIWELLEDFLFMATAILATGNTNSFIGTAFAKYCYILNLGGMLMDTNEMMNFPISRFLVNLLPFLPSKRDEQMDEDFFVITRAMAYIVNYVLSAYFVLFRYPLGVCLNRSIISAFIALRGMASLLKNYKKDDEGKSIATSSFLGGWWGGALVIVFSIASIHFSRLVDDGRLPLPEWLSFLLWIEHLVEKFVYIADVLI